jgi:hypothetical protein
MARKSTWASSSIRSRGWVPVGKDQGRNHSLLGLKGGESCPFLRGPRKRHVRVCVHFRLCTGDMAVVQSEHVQDHDRDQLHHGSAAIVPFSSSTSCAFLISPPHRCLPTLPAPPNHLQPYLAICTPATLLPLSFYLSPSSPSLPLLPHSIRRGVLYKTISFFVDIRLSSIISSSLWEPEEHVIVVIL